MLKPEATLGVEQLLLPLIGDVFSGLTDGSVL